MFRPPARPPPLSFVLFCPEESWLPPACLSFAFLRGRRPVRGPSPEAATSQSLWWQWQRGIVSKISGGACRWQVGSFVSVGVRWGASAGDRTSLSMRWHAEDDVELSALLCSNFQIGLEFTISPFFACSTLQITTSRRYTD